MLVTIHADGTVTVDHSGIEMGQGINTKVLQAVSMELGKSTKGVPVAMTKLSLVLPKNTNNYSSATPTWGSGTSEVVVGAAIKACDTLNSRLKAYVAKNPSGTWEEIVAAASSGGVDLSASHSHTMLIDGGTYYIYAACCSVVELDSLTGEYEILSADIVYDAGVSLNPEIDIGQVEGCFVQAAGCLLSEEQTWSKTDGRLVSNGTWDYKVPSSLDIPVSMSVTLLPTSNTAKCAVMGSKASGEPAYILGATPFFALKAAIKAARDDAAGGKATAGYFRLDAPATPQRVQQLCNSSPPF